MKRSNIKQVKSMKKKKGGKLQWLLGGLTTCLGVDAHGTWCWVRFPILTLEQANRHHLQTLKQQLTFATCLVPTGRAVHSLKQIINITKHPPFDFELFKDIP